MKEDISVTNRIAIFIIMLSITVIILLNILAILENIDLKNVKLQEGETVDAKVVPFTEFESMIKNDMIAKNVEKCYHQYLKEYYEKNLK